MDLQKESVVEFKAKIVRTPFLPIHFEENLYLAVNQKYWDIDTLSSVFQSD